MFRKQLKKTVNFINESLHPKVNNLDFARILCMERI
jgi:hypothetical protein